MKCLHFIVVLQYRISLELYITVVEDKISLQRVAILQPPMQTSRTKQIYLNYLNAFYFMKSNGNILAIFTKHKNKH
jgi:hypothetical protein